MIDYVLSLFSRSPGLYKLFNVLGESHMPTESWRRVLHR